MNGLMSLLSLPKSAAIERLGKVDMPAMVRIGLTAGLMRLGDDDYNHYAYLLREAVSALAETERGRKVLDEIGISVPAPAGVH